MKEADFRNSRLSQFFCTYCLNPLWAQKERRPAQRDQLWAAAGGNTCTAAKTEALTPRRCRTELPRVTERRAEELGCGLRWGQVLTLAGCSRFPPPHPRRERCLCWLIHSRWLACSLEEERGEAERGVGKKKETDELTGEDSCIKCWSQNPELPPAVVLQMRRQGEQRSAARKQNSPDSEKEKKKQKKKWGAGNTQWWKY